MANADATGLSFDVYVAGTLLDTFVFDGSSVTIGSGEAAVLRLDDPEIEPLHAVVSLEDDGTATLNPLGAAPVLCDGEPIRSVTLRDGDAFEIGDAQFVIGLAASDDASDETPPSMFVDDEDESDVPIEDVLEWLNTNAQNKTGPGVDRERPKVLEVSQVWKNALLDTRHYSKRSLGRDISIGNALGYRWRLLGIDMGWVPAPLRLVLPYTPPMWSEVICTQKSDFFAPDQALALDEHVLFEHVLDEESYTARIEAGWDGFVDTDECRYTFDELVHAGLAQRSGDAYEIPMREGHRLMVDVGGVVFFSHLVDPGARPIQKGESPDLPFISIASFVAFVGLMFGLVMAFSPKPAQNELTELPSHFVELVLEQDDEKPEVVKAPDANPDAGEGAKPQREEGEVGKKDATMEEARGNKVEIQKQELDRTIAENAGAMGFFSESGAMDGIFGSSALNAELAGGVGGLMGAKGTKLGSGGLGSRGSSLGGGGSAEGIGGMGTKGVGSGRAGYGTQGGSLGVKTTGQIGGVGGDPIILGALDRALIDAVIKRHMQSIRYCYQRELTKNPALAGKVTVKFVISGDGSVSSAKPKSSTIGSAAVESCVTQRFLQMQFPEPLGNGIVIVSYPFIFAPG